MARWAPLDPWCTSLGKSGTGQVPWRHDATQREVRTVWAADRPDGVKTRAGVKNPAPEAIKRGAFQAMHAPHVELLSSSLP